MIDATCVAGVVTAAGVLVDDAVVLSQGTASSDGALLIDQDKAKYLTSNASDIETLITNVGAIVQKIVEILTNHDTVTTTPGSAAANIALLAALKVQLDLTKDLLK